MIWFRRFRARQLIRAQEIILARIKAAKKAESECITAAIIMQTPYAQLLDGDWMAKAREWRSRRREHKARFLYLQKKIDDLLRE